MPATAVLYSMQQQGLRQHRRTPENKETTGEAKKSMNIDKSRVHSKNKTPATAGSKAETIAGTPATERKFNNSRVGTAEWQGQYGR
jgi:hypothetical protein